MKIINVVGARPNFMKIAPLQRAFAKYPRQIQYKLIHTGQHYDENMSASFFRDLGIRKPDYNLSCGSGRHGEQTGRIMIACEKVLLKEKPDVLVVAGDVNSTIACGLVAAKMGVRVAHIEAGCRSFDRTMPEEINRVLTDAIADYLFTIDKIAIANLRNEGISRNKIHLVGDIMIDSLRWAMDLQEKDLRQFNDYGLVTMHRPSNVDCPAQLVRMLKIIKELQKNIKLVFPVHPRTRERIWRTSAARKLKAAMTNVIWSEPLGYNDFISLLRTAKFVLTDSGSLQQETAYLNIPCLTLRENTERPVTITHGTSTLVGSSRQKIMSNVRKIINGTYKQANKIPLWDGRAAERITRILLNTRNP